MKKLTLIIFVLFLCQITASSQPCPDSLYITSQAQIDSFQINYPGCTEIEGDVEISGDDIMNLYGLSVLTSIGGYIDIWENHALTSLTGLDNIEAASIDNLYITSNSSLSTCEVQSICDYIANPGGTISFHDNNISTDDGREIEEVSIYTLTGKRILKVRPANATIDISSLQVGMYIVEVIIENIL
jgi:hypothetical protein